MREQRCSKRMETELDFYHGNDSVNEVLENHELINKIEKALSTLREQAKSRFLKYYGNILHTAKLLKRRVRLYRRFMSQ